ncbi:MAG: hypothetical protein ACI9WS_000134 [Paraglaciecola psychrophila]|jgi:hypothetical protein
MKIYKEIVLPLLLCCSISGCNTLTFVQNEETRPQPKSSHWHHATLNGMVEISPPLNLKEVCKGTSWNKITTEHRFYNTLSELLLPRVAGLLLYSSWTAEVECYSPRLSAE